MAADRERLARSAYARGRDLAGSSYRKSAKRLREAAKQRRTEEQRETLLAISADREKRRQQRIAVQHVLRLLNAERKAVGRRSVDFNDRKLRQDMLDARDDVDRALYALQLDRSGEDA